MSPEGETIVQNKIWRTPANLENGGAKGQRGIDMAPAQPHTVSKEARTCASCHASSKALGYGTHDGRYMKAFTQGVYVDLATAQGEIISRNTQIQIPPIPELTMDLDQVVTRDNEQLQTVGHHWPLSGPLTKETRDRMEKVGVCISCHKDFTPGFFSRVHKKDFHSDTMEDIMKPGQFFHQIYNPDLQLE